MRLRLVLRQHNYLTTEALINPSESAWHTLYASRSEGSFISTVSLDPESFDALLEHFDRYYIVKSGPGKRGRPPKLQSKHSVMACFCISTPLLSSRKLCASCSVYLLPRSTESCTKLKLALSECLNVMSDAAITWPTLQQQRQWAGFVQIKEPLIEGCFCVADGENYHVQQPTTAEIQNAYYNGCIHQF